MAIWMPPVDAAAVARTDPTKFTGKPGMFFYRDLRKWSLTGGEAGPLGGDGGVGMWSVRKRSALNYQIDSARPKI